MLSNLDNPLLDTHWLAGEGFRQNISIQITMHYSIEKVSVSSLAIKAAAFRKFAERGKDVHEASSFCVATCSHRICKTHWERQFKTLVSQISINARFDWWNGFPGVIIGKINIGNIWYSSTGFCTLDIIVLHSYMRMRTKMKAMARSISLTPSCRRIYEYMTYRVFAQHFVSYEISQYVRGAQCEEEHNSV